MSARLILAPLCAAAIAALAGCNASNDASSLAIAKGKPREAPPVNFSESEYGVKASPRVTLSSGSVPRGGGHHKIGKPYKVRGLWYVPKEEPDYSKAGRASWYGPNFHGRKTANGEVFDQNHLSAAHTTFPLPSYARVTNLANGRSVVVRVNDRGPYSHSRIIDVSKKAAEVLKFKRAGTAKVRVDYVGRAPLEGEDVAALMTTLREGEPGSAPAPAKRDATSLASLNPVSAAKRLIPAANVSPKTSAISGGLRGAH